MAPLFGRVADERGPHGFIFFSNYPNWLKLEIENGCLPCSKNSQCLHVSRLGHYEQFAQLCRHPICDRIRVKNPETYSTFESLMDFKRDLNLLEKSDKFSKITS
jgi:hypothetical protein